MYIEIIKSKLNIQIKLKNKNNISFARPQMTKTLKLKSQADTFQRA